MPGHRQTRRFRKRTFVVTGITLLCLLLAGSLISFLVAQNLGPADVVRISLSENDGAGSVLGSGVSLSGLETLNLLQDPSYEPYIFRQALTVYHGDESNIIVSSEDAAAGYYGDGFFNDAYARIMTWSGQGMTLKKTAAVSSYGINRVGIFQEVELPGDVPDVFVISDFAYANEIAVAVGDNGLIVRNVAGQAPEIIDVGLRSDLTDISACASGFVACSAEGELLFSENGLIWDVSTSLAGQNLIAVAGSDQDIYVAVDVHGNFYSGSGDRQGKTYYKAESQINDIVYCRGSFIAVGNEGTILTSAAGLIWQREEGGGSTDWLAAGFLEDKVVIAGENGSIMTCSEDSSRFELLENEGGPDFIDIVMLSRQQFIAIDTQGWFFISNDGGYHWQRSGIDPGMHSKVIALAGKDKIISADNQGTIGLAQLVAEFQMDSPLREGQYQAGDLLYLEKNSVTIPESLIGYGSQGIKEPGFWKFYGPGIFARTIEYSAPGGGEGALLIDRTGYTEAAPAIVSQQIEPLQISAAASNEIYEIELWLRHEGIDAGDVQVWLSGAVDPVGTSFSHVGNSWKKYTYAFVFPEMPMRNDSALFFNISYPGHGKLWIDRLFLGPAAETGDAVETAEINLLEKIAPAVLRLGFLNIGSNNCGNESWALPPGNEHLFLLGSRWLSIEGNSLQTGLQLALRSSADPWLIIDSYISESEMIHLIEYLSAPISEYYGRLRQQNGSVVPWTDQFNRIYLEFQDSSDLLQNDRNRAEFVDLMIRTAARSPYYQQIKSNLVFIDGMLYEEGVMLSRADYHASDINGVIAGDGREAVDQAYREFFESIPRNLEKSSSSWTELIRSAGLSGNGLGSPATADLTYLLLADLGQQSSLANLELPDRQDNEWSDAWSTAASVAAKSAIGAPLSVEYFSEESGTNESQLNGAAAFGFQSENQISVVLTNQSDEMLTCELLTDINLKGADIFQYDSEGMLLSEQKFRRQESRINILPGGVILIVKERGS